MKKIYHSRKFMYNVVLMLCTHTIWSSSFMVDRQLATLEVLHKVHNSLLVRMSEIDVGHVPLLALG